MSLEKEKIISNTKKFFDTATKAGFMNDGLITTLGQDFMSAPDNTHSEEGSLIDTILNVTKNLVKINDLLPETKRFDKPSLLKVGLLHQIGKAKLFIPNPSDWHKKQGKIYDYDKSLVSMRIGQRSLYYAMSNGVTFTEEEAQSLLFYDVDCDDRMVQFYSSKLCRMLKMAIELTSIEKH